MDRIKRVKTIYLCLLVATSLCTVGCRGRGAAPKIPAVAGEGAVISEEEGIFLKEAPEGTRGLRAIK